MTSEFRKVDRKLALYTDDNRIYRSFYRWQQTLFKVPYLKNGRMIGIDMYFDRQVRDTVRQVINGQLMLDI